MNARGANGKRLVIGYNGRRFTDDEIRRGLDDPGDPFGLAHVSDRVINYMAPMLGGEIERAEAVRRRRTAGK